MTRDRNLADSTPKPNNKASNNASPLPPHIEETVRAISRLHAEHYQRATFSDRLVDRATSLFGRPAFVVGLTLAVALWVGGNLLLSNTIHFSFDAPPFPWLEDGLTLLALYMGALILTSQRRADHLGELREQMTLELAILTAPFREFRRPLEPTTFNVQQNPALVPPQNVRCACGRHDSPELSHLT